jgi:hypothetical protein
LAFHGNAAEPPLFTRLHANRERGKKNTLKNPFLKYLDETIFKRINDPCLWGEHGDGAGSRFYSGVPEALTIALQCI